MIASKPLRSTEVPRSRLRCNEQSCLHNCFFLTRLQLGCCSVLGDATVTGLKHFQHASYTSFEIAAARLASPPARTSSRSLARISSSCHFWCSFICGQLIGNDLSLVSRSRPARLVMRSPLFLWSSTRAGTSCDLPALATLRFVCLTSSPSSRDGFSSHVPFRRFSRTSTTRNGYSYNPLPLKAVRHPGGEHPPLFCRWPAQ